MGGMVSVCVGLLASAALAECVDIISGPNYPQGEDGFVEGAVCLKGCDASFMRIIPGNDWASTQSTGGPVQVACFKGTLHQNPDGTWACNGNNGWYVGTESREIGGVRRCANPIGPPYE